MHTALSASLRRPQPAPFSGPVSSQSTATRASEIARKTTRHLQIRVQIHVALLHELEAQSALSLGKRHPALMVAPVVNSAIHRKKSCNINASHALRCAHGASCLLRRPFQFHRKPFRLRRLHRLGAILRARLADSCRLLLLEIFVHPELDLAGTQSCRRSARRPGPYPRKAQCVVPPRNGRIRILLFGYADQLRPEMRQKPTYRAASPSSG